MQSDPMSMEKSPKIGTSKESESSVAADKYDRALYLMKRKLRRADRNSLSLFGYFKWKYESILSRTSLYICESWWFQVFILVAIVGAGVTVGLETYPPLSNNSNIQFTDNIILLSFIIEFVLKIVSYGTRPWL
jgi:hypothetical protein